MNIEQLEVRQLLSAPSAEPQESLVLTEQSKETHEAIDQIFSEAEGGDHAVEQEHAEIEAHIEGEKLVLEFSHLPESEVQLLDEHGHAVASVHAQGDGTVEIDLPHEKGTYELRIESKDHELVASGEVIVDDHGARIEHWETDAAEEHGNDENHKEDHFHPHEDHGDEHDEKHEDHNEDHGDHAHKHLHAHNHEHVHPHEEHDHIHFLHEHAEHEEDHGEEHAEHEEHAAKHERTVALHYEDEPMVPEHAQTSGEEILVAIDQVFATDIDAVDHPVLMDTADARTSMQRPGQIQESSDTQSHAIQAGLVRLVEIGAAGVSIAIGRLAWKAHRRRKWNAKA